MLWIVAVVLLALAAALGGVVVAAMLSGAPEASITSAPPSNASPSSPSPAPSAMPTPPAPSADSAQAALTALDGLETVSGYADSPYERARFGQAWYDVDRNGCDTRNDILGRDLLDPVFKPGTRDCKVLSGTLIDPYDGQRVAFVSGQNTSVLVQIDHIVALAWAWRHGAEHWTDDERLRFANDPRNLQAASQQTNQEKSDSGPGEWLPPVPALRCVYVEDWVAGLAAYDLGVSADDRSAAEAVLRRC